MESILTRDRLGAFCRETHVELKPCGTGPLTGLTFAAKDVFHVAAHRTGAGNPDWLRTHEPEARTAPAVQQLLEAGAKLVGKALCDELAYSLMGENVHYGTPVNVNAPGRVPGGSSSGSAAAVAGGLVDFALGTDTGGSVRFPASCCGIFGIRPTHGRVSLEEAVPLAPSFDTCGWFARDADILERAGRVLLKDERPAPQPGKLLLAQDAFELAGAGVTRALAPAVARVASKLGAPQPVTIAAEGLERWMNGFRVLQGAEVWAKHGAWVTSVNPAFGPGVKERFEWAATIPARDVAAANARREEIALRLDGLLADDALLCLPSAPGVAPPLNAPAAELDAFRSRALAMLCIAGLARLPQMSLPLGRLEGCPLGLSLIARRGGDLMLLAFARVLCATR